MRKLPVPPGQGSIRFAELESGRSLIAPDLIFFAGLGNVAWKRARQGDISPEHAFAVAQARPQLLSGTVPSRDLLGSAMELDHSVYGSLYVALAADRQAPLVTADTRLLRRLSGANWSGTVTDLGWVR